MRGRLNEGMDFLHSRMAFFSGLAALLSLLFAGSAEAHPHVWVTVKAQVEFDSEGRIAAVIHDWVFDEMYSSFATQGLASPGSLVTRAQFAPMARENAGGLADVGYFTTLKVGGKAVEFGSVSDYWMQERPDHRVAFHVRMPLKEPMRVAKFMTLRVADPEFFIDFEYDDKDPIRLVSAPSGCSASVARPPPLESGDKQKLDKSFSPISRPAPTSGSRWRAARSSPARDSLLGGARNRLAQCGFVAYKPALRAGSDTPGGKGASNTIKENHHGSDQATRGRDA